MPFKNLKFIFPWRTYQQKFINNIHSHIIDNHLHVVAPPGSGKTILGLEIMRQLGKKTLVLAPTLTVRNQWEDRLQNFFLKDETYQDYSFDLSKPKAVTFSTYQSLHAFYKRFEFEADYYSFFEKEKIEVIILDEAHHLKNAWWKCLYSLKIEQNLTVVALTATPPYDSEPIEVSKYFKLCGEIDDEIAVPELIIEGDLCPHQDFVYFSKPKDLEINFIFDYRMKISNFIDAIKTDTDFISFINSHRFITKTQRHLPEIYDNPEYFSALLIFLNAINQNVPLEKLNILGFEKNDEIDFPSFSTDWAQLLFQNLLITDRMALILNEKYLNSLEQKLKRLNIFENKKVDLVGGDFLYKSLANSPSKLQSIVSIVTNEYCNLKHDLRAVILTDYIKKEFKNTKTEAIQSINRLGVIPIFHYLRTSEFPKKNIAVLTGSLVIIHATTIAAFEKFEDIDNFTISPLESDPEFIEITPKTVTNHLVNTITKLFENGNIKILVGTKSLLGEGWDAPSINTLVLASFIGSFVSSNQMRGRAIRSEKKNTHKTGNIWHLACLDPTVNNGGKDIATLKRRFDAFIGVSNNEENEIESGIDRLNLPTNFKDVDTAQLNIKTLEQAKNRHELKTKWTLATHKGTGISREIKEYYSGEVPYEIAKKSAFKDVVRYNLLELSVAITFFLPKYLIENFHEILSKGFLAFMYSLLGALGLTFGYKSYIAIKNYIQFGLLHKDLEKISHALLDSMLELNIIHTDKIKIRLLTYIQLKGEVVCSIQGTTAIESAIYINALQEIIEPIKNPRYLIIKKSWSKQKFNIQNYYSVPQIFGDKKERCQIFLANWEKNVCKSTLVYTRHYVGRKILIRARMYHLSTAFEKKTKKAVIWN